MSKIYPLRTAGKPPPEMNFVDMSGLPFNFDHSGRLRFWEMLNEAVQERAHGGSRLDDARLLGLDRHREGQAVRARRADEDNPDRSGGNVATRPRARLPSKSARRRPSSSRKQLAAPVHSAVTNSRLAAGRGESAMGANLLLFFGDRRHAGDGEKMVGEGSHYPWTAQVPTATHSMAARTTSCICRRTFRSRTSGR